MTVPLAHDVQGSGPLLVLIHGITENRHTWDPLTPDLAGDHRVLRVDLRGHGESPLASHYDLPAYAADVHALVDELPLVVGHSLGGAVATAYAAAYDVRGVVNVDQSLDLAGFQAQLKAAEPMLRGDAFDDVMAGLFASLRGALPDAEWARVTELQRADQQVVLGTWALMLEQDEASVAAAVREMTSTVHAPYLALNGVDPGPDYARWLAEHISQARLEVWDGLGHYPHLVEPQRFLDRLRAFEQELT